MRQQYIAKELTHFTKEYDVFCKILNGCILLGGGPNKEESNKLGTCFSFSYRKDISQNEMIEVNKVCFSDIPEGQTDIHKVKFGNFGISFDKDFIVKKGGIPVHYVPRDTIINSRWANDGEKSNSFFDRMTKELYEYFDSLICKSSQDQDVEKREKYQRLHDFCMTGILPYYKFFDHKLEDGDSNNYYFEREWRIVGNVKFELSDIRNVILPQEDEKRFKNDFPNYQVPINGSAIKS